MATFSELFGYEPQLGLAPAGEDYLTISAAQALPQQLATSWAAQGNLLTNSDRNDHGPLCQGAIHHVLI